MSISLLLFRVSGLNKPFAEDIQIRREGKGGWEMQGDETGEALDKNARVGRIKSEDFGEELRERVGE